MFFSFKIRLGDNKYKTEQKPYFDLVKTLQVVNDVTKCAHVQNVWYKTDGKDSTPIRFLIFNGF